MRKALIERPAGVEGPNEQRLYRFKNHFGASVVRGHYSYGGDAGMWELAVLEWEGTGNEGDDWHLTYETPVTNDVIGWLDEDGVDLLLEQIEALPPRGE